MSARFLILCSLILTLFSCAEPQVKLLSPSIIPAPQSLQVNPGHFTINEELR